MMKTRLLCLLVFAGLLAACAGPAPEATESVPPAPTETAMPSPTPFPMSADGLFTGDPQTFLLNDAVLAGSYVAADAGMQTPNERLLEARPDGAAYIEATGRLDGWQIQYDRVGEGAGPLYIIQVVNMYDSLEGPEVVLSREWHADVWERIDSGQLELLPEFEDLPVTHLVWWDGQGTVGVEMLYRNLYIFFTGPSEGEDNYAFFGELARAHLEWIQSREP